MAAFDFDGTITDARSLFGYLRAAVGAPRVLKAAAIASPRIVGTGIAGRGVRDRAKELVVGRALQGEEAARAVKVGESFVEQLLERSKRPEVARRIEWHRCNGHELLIVSASPDVYIEPAGRILEMDGVVCTLMEVGPDGLLTGSFASPNCRGTQKASRLMSWIGEEPAKIWAYGNSKSDADMLRIADVAVRVGRQPLVDLP